MRIVRRLLFLVMLVVVAGVVFLGARSAAQQRDVSTLEQQEREVIDSMIVAPADMRVTVGATGAVASARQTALTFQSVGVVDAVLVEAGDTVQAGDVIARLESANLETALATAQVALEAQQIAFDALTAPPRPEDIAAAEAAVVSAQAAMNAAFSTGPSAQEVEIARLRSELSRNQLWQAQLQRDLTTFGGPGFDVASLLPDGSGVPQEVIDQANAALASASASQLSGANTASGLTQAEFGVQIADASAAAVAGRTPNQASMAQAQASLTSAQAALDRLNNGATELDLQIAALGVQQAQIGVEQAQLALDRTILRAPFSGVVADINLTVGEPPPASAQSLPVTLVDLSEYHIDVAVDETDVVDLQTGQQVEVRLDGVPDAVIRGDVTRIAPAPVIAGQLVTYPVRITLDAAGQPVRLGMSATATIIVDALQDVLVVPNRFIRIDRATQQAFVTIERAPGEYEEIPVTLGLRNETESQVVSGIAAGDQLVLLPRGTWDPIAAQAGPRR